MSVLSEDRILKSAMKVLRVDKPSRIILFGSYARGEATAESDLDLLVLVKKSKKRNPDGHLSKCHWKSNSWCGSGYMSIQ
ncbi:MAG: nucleotidyltransferase domain-containing protein [Methanospirillum sp.]|uniref:nucleotidyltransferase domain-containing protein n=1 Tax=Methanospirillum sp. TaxID=45200 RepID=UPI00236B3F34|nr:nucleotidyltransferase domain-containing protein [Methanospirillum sp.]MDD1730158.1 nucleotidyltransferase domain-containing protein [Methanospirillum sp.]